MRRSKFDRALIVVLLLFSAWSLVGVSRLRFTYDIERFFPQDDAALAYYKTHRERFGDEMRTLVVALELPNGLNSDALHRIAELTDSLRAVPMVEAVRSLTTLSEPFRMPLGGWILAPFFQAPYTDVATGTERLAQQAALNGIFLSADERATNVVLTLGPMTKATEGRITLERIWAQVQRTGMSAHYAGRIATQQHYLSATQQQMLGLGAAALVLMTLVLFLLFRCPITALSPILISALALLWTFGPLGWLGLGIEPLLSLLPALLLVLGSSFSIHIITRFREHRSRGQGRAEAMQHALSDTRRANILSAVSTAIGFASLALYPISPLQVFGMAAGWGMLAAWVAAREVLPRLAPVLADARIRSAMTTTIPGFSRTSGATLWLALGLIAAALLVAPRLNVNNYFLDDLDHTSDLGHDVVFFEEHLSGTRPLEIGITATDQEGTLLAPDALQALDTLARALASSFGTAPPLSPADLVRAAMRSEHRGDRLPRDAQESRHVRRTLERALHGGAAFQLLDSSFTQGRISGRTPDIGSAAFAARMKALDPLLHNAHITATVTGGAWLMDLANKRIARVLLLGILTAVLLNALLVAASLRSVRMGVVSILPNLVPLATTTIAMWLFAIPLKVGTAMVFPILYGIALDDTMHVLMHPDARKGGQGMLSAVRELFPSLRNTTLVISLGFGLFGFSSFPSIAVFGVLTAFGLWVALAADAWLLAALKLRPMGTNTSVQQALAHP